MCKIVLTSDNAKNIATPLAIAPRSKGTLKELEISIKDITAGYVEDYYLGMYLYSYATNLLYQNRIDDAVDVVKLSAQCRDELGIKYCIEHEIDFSSSKKLFK